MGDEEAWEKPGMTEAWSYKNFGQSAESKAYRDIMRKFMDAGEDALCCNKEACKKFLDKNGFRTPKTYHIIDTHPVDPQILFQVPSRFVLKPHNLWNGQGVLIIERCGERFVEPDGREHSAAELIATLGQPSPGKFFIIEERIAPHKDIARLSPYGTLSDFRICFVNRRLLIASIRIPTQASRGYGNVHNGAFQVSVDSNGVITQVPYTLNQCTVHPDSGVDLHGTQIPKWGEVFREVSAIPPLFKSHFISVDGCIGEDGRFVVIELTLLPFLYWLSSAGFQRIMQLNEASKS
jgi:hypothetical protein